MIGLIQVGAFLKRNLSHFKKWGTDRRSKRDFVMWLSWHLAKENVCVVADNGKIIATGIARSLGELNQAKNSYLTVSGGKILLVEHVVAKTNESFKDLLRFCKQRWPQCTHISFRRNKGIKFMKTYDIESFYRKAGI